MEGNGGVWRRLLLSTLSAGVLLLALYLLLRRFGWTAIDREGLQQSIAATGAVAPLAYIGITVLQVTLIPIPGAVTILAGNYLFGAWRAFLYSYIGMLAGSMLAYFLGKLLGRPFVNWIAGGADVTERWLKKLRKRENVLLFFAFLFPCFPDDLLCAVAGVLPITVGVFFLMQLITRATSIGATLLFLSGEVIPFSGWGIPVLCAVGLLGLSAFLLCMRYADRINALLERLSDRILGFLGGKPGGR
ncbi:MAG: TVP38/TMEM64 family protein [Ruminococcaceae bacterium]|nr:TVP38/TMEM64 family protein [Oscillospiraceae bacterium]